MGEGGRLGEVDEGVYAEGGLLEEGVGVGACGGWCVRDEFDGDVVVCTYGRLACWLVSGNVDVRMCWLQASPKSKCESVGVGVGWVSCGGASYPRLMPQAIISRSQDQHQNQQQNQREYEDSNAASRPAI